jgi:uncharacterized protein
MSTDEILGRHVTLPIRRFGPAGAFLGTGDGDEVVLLPGGEMPTAAREGDPVDVFVHLDSEARPIATTRRAKLELGEVAFLTVSALTGLGTFVDWGLPKELLVPFAEQTADVVVGDRYAIGLYRDSSGRFAGTMRVSEMLDRKPVEWTDDEWVDGEAWRQDPEIGLFVIVERSYVGLVPKEEPHALARGEGARFRVANVLPDGKLELSLRGHAHQELASDARRILADVSRPGAPAVRERSSPDEVRRRFGLSKKAFKRAVGRLLKEGAVTIDGEGFLRATARA